MSPSEVSLPVCPSCGEQRTLKVTLDAEEQQADNLLQYGMVPTEVEVHHPITGEMLRGLIPALKPVGMNPYHERNKEFHRQLVAFGKLPPGAR